MSGMKGSALSPMSSQLDFAAVGEIVIAKICACAGCSRSPAQDLPSSLAFIFQDKQQFGGRAKLFFVPKPLANGGYTQAQLAEIESQLVYFGGDLYPLDTSLLL